MSVRVFHLVTVLSPGRLVGPGTSTMDRLLREELCKKVMSADLCAPLPGTPQPCVPTLRIESVIERRIPSVLQSHEAFAMKCHIAFMKHCEWLSCGL